MIHPSPVPPGLLPVTRAPGRLLVARFDAYGDLVLLTGLLAAIHAAWPATAIHLVVRDRYLDLAPLVPTPVRWRGVPEAALAGPPRAVPPPALAAILDEDWDLVLTTRFARTPPDDLVLHRLGGRGVPCVGIGGAAAALVPVPVPEFSHETEKYQLLWSSLTGQNDLLPPPRLTVPPAAAATARTLLGAGGLAPGRFVACLPAGIQNNPFKAWPADRFAACLDHLQARHGLPALLFGHAGERVLVETAAAAARARGATPLVWLGTAGEMPVLAALLAESRLYLGNDSGPLHIAQALGVPAVSIFGGGHWPRFTPRGPGITCHSPWPCAGCGWECPFGDMPCVAAVPLAGVVAAIDRVLAGSPVDERLAFPARERLMERLWAMGTGGGAPVAYPVGTGRLITMVKGTLLALARRLGYTVVHTQELAAERMETRRLRGQLEALQRLSTDEARPADGRGV